MVSILILVVFGLLVGILAKVIHPGPEKIGLAATIVIGICGSFVGGGINWIMGMGNHPFHPSGFIMSIVGGILCCAVYRWWTLKNSPTGPKSFFTGKNLR